MRKETLIDISFLDDHINLEDKICQEYLAFLRQEDVQCQIQQLRARYGIHPDDIRRRLEEYAELERQASKGYEKFRNKAKELGFADHSPEFYHLEATLGSDEWLSLEVKERQRLNDYVRQLLPEDAVSNLLYRFKKPASWERSLRGYILTGVKRKPDLPYKIRSNKNCVRIEVYATTTKDDYDLVCKVVYHCLKYLGNSSSKKRDHGRKIKIGRKRDRIWVDVFPGTTVRGIRAVYPRLLKWINVLPGAQLRNIRARTGYNKKILTAIRYDAYRMSPRNKFNLSNSKADKAIYQDDQEQKKQELVEMVQYGTLDLPEDLRDVADEDMDVDEEKRLYNRIRQIARRSKTFRT